MDAFSYLSVLLSIILGLAITQVLQGVRGLLLCRARVRLYWPTLLWSALILVFATQSWWASFGYSSHQTWTFAGFGMILLQTTLLYMLAALVLPDFAGEAPVDLRAHFYRESRPFFGITVAMLAVSVAKDFVIDGHLPVRANLAFHLVFAAFGVSAAISRNTRVHEVLAALTALLVTIYIAALFATLR